MVASQHRPRRRENKLAAEMNAANVSFSFNDFQNISLKKNTIYLWDSLQLVLSVVLIVEVGVFSGKWAMAHLAYAHLISVDTKRFSW